MNKQTIVLTTVALLLTALLVTGCGMETEKADELILEANDIIADFQPKLTQVEAFLETARDQAEARTGDDAAQLQQAQTLTDEIDAGINDAKSKIDEAASLNIEEQKRSYLEAKSSSLDIMLSLNETMSELAGILVADPSALNPETLVMWTALLDTMNEQSRLLVEAEVRASKIVEENGE
jgi:hypothetical protein